MSKAYKSKILAAVRPCPDQPFTSLQRLVRQHSRAVSSFVCVLLDWDEPRRLLVRELRGLGLPIVVLVIAGPEAAPALHARRSEGGPAEFHLLEVGKITEGLQQLQNKTA